VQEKIRHTAVSAQYVNRSQKFKLIYIHQMDKILHHNWYTTQQ